MVKIVESDYFSLQHLIANAADTIAPPVRMSVTEAAIKYREINNHISTGPYNPDISPYQVEVQDSINSREYGTVVLVGPAQAAKTDTMFNVMVALATTSPKDILVIEKDMVSARKMGKGRMAKLLIESPEMNKLALKGNHNRSIYMTQFRTGMTINFGWPSVSQLSGQPWGIVWIPDYDRGDVNVGDEGSKYALSLGRTTTYGRDGCVVVESSPSAPNKDPKWRPETPHDVPPVGKIVSIYRIGDRRRWFWQCIDCFEWFEPGFFEVMRYDESLTPFKAGQTARVACPHCADDDYGTGIYYQHGETRYTDAGEPIERPGKFDLNLAGRWVPDGQRLNKKGKIIGKKLNDSDVASFLLKGPAAAFADWDNIVTKYLEAEETYTQTGNDGDLKTVTNTQLGEIYTPRHLGSTRLPGQFIERAEDLGDRVVPEGVRFIVATVDTQKNCWIVQIHGIGVEGRMWVIDRFDIKRSDRTSEDGDHYNVEPHTYLEDWDLIEEQVVKAQYPLADESGRFMPVFVTGVDAYGVAGTTVNAYQWFRNLKHKEGDLQRYVKLLKGEPKNDAPLIKRGFPSSGRTDRKAQSRGAVPVHFIGSTMAKDMFNNILNRPTDGPGFVRFPDWLSDDFFDELVAEEKDLSGRWIKPSGVRNESWDLLVYAFALLHELPIRLPTLKWDKPPGWADDWDNNSLIVAEDGDLELNVTEDLDNLLINLGMELT